MDLLQSLQELLTALYNVGTAIVILLAPWTPLLAWIAFWALAVNWIDLRRVLLSGGWIAVVLLMVVAIIGWGVVAPPESGSHVMFGLTLSNFVGKTVYVTALVVIALLCGSVQLSGLLGSWARFEERQPAPAPHAH